MQRLALLALLLVAVAADTRAAGLPTSEGKVSRPGFDLHYSVVGGAGPYVVVLSGGPGEEVRSMQGIADELGKTHRCVLLEQRGTGRSRLRAYDASTINLSAYIEDIEALRVALAAPRVVVLGNSWGMMLALAYAGTHPAQVRAVVTLGSGPITRAYLGVFSDNLSTRLPPAATEVVQFWSEPSRREARFERASFERARASAPAYFFDRARALAYAMELSPADFNPYVIPAFLKADGDFDLRPKLRAITAPTLLLQGRQDLAGEANLIEAHELIAGSRLEFLDRCGHMPWLEQPEQTWRIVHEFLDPLSK